MKKLVAGCAIVLFSLLLALPAAAQEGATLVLRNGERPSGELVDLNASGFTLRVNGTDQQFPENDVAAIEFVVGPPSAEAQTRLDAGQQLVVLRNGEIVEGRLSDIGGTHPLRLTVDTRYGKRDFTSNDVAQVHLHSQRKVASVTAPDGSAAVARGAIVVQANQPWTNSGINVSKGDKVVFDASGDIMISANASSGIGGSPAATVPTIRYPVPNAPVGALIGRINLGKPFLIGPNRDPITMPANGTLQIGVNDDHFQDNTGTYTVTITKVGR